jgi:predicted GNAT superfamily acetyltransferase
MTSVPPILIHHAETDRDILRCLPVLRELRPDLLPETFLSTIQRMQNNGYHLVMLESNHQVVAVAGYRFSEHLARGKFLYIDDLVTAAAERRNGYGQKLFEWLVKMAEAADCQEVHLDSGVQRSEAHLFYEEQKMIFSSRHYSLKRKSA